MRISFRAICVSFGRERERTASREIFAGEFALNSELSRVCVCTLYVRTCRGSGGASAAIVRIPMGAVPIPMDEPFERCVRVVCVCVCVRGVDMFLLLPRFPLLSFELRLYFASHNRTSRAETRPAFMGGGMNGGETKGDPPRRSIARRSRRRLSGVDVYRSNADNLRDRLGGRHRVIM